MTTRDPSIEKLLRDLAADTRDALHATWTEIADRYEDGDCCRALKMMVSALLARQQGRTAREDRKFDSCPYPEFSGAPLKASDHLRLSWLDGYDQQDVATRCRQAESKILEAYAKLSEIRERLDAHDAGEPFPISEETKHRVRQLQSTILTPGLKMKLRNGRGDGLANGLDDE